MLTNVFSTFQFYAHTYCAYMDAIDAPAFRALYRTLQTTKTTLFENLLGYKFLSSSRLSIRAFQGYSVRY